MSDHLNRLEDRKPESAFFSQLKVDGRFSKNEELAPMVFDNKKIAQISLNERTKPVDFPKTLRNDSDLFIKSRSNSRNSKGKKGEFDGSKPKSPGYGNCKADRETLQSNAQPRVKNSTKYRKTFDEGLFKEENNSVNKASRSRKVQAVEKGEEAGMSENSISKKSADKSPHRKLSNQTKSKTADNFMKFKPENQDVSGLKKESAAIERGLNSIGIDFDQIKKETTLFKDQKSPKERLSYKEQGKKEVEKDITEQTDQDQTEGKSGFELPTKSNWVPLPQNSKASIENIEDGYQELGQQQEEDIIYAGLGEPVACTESSVLKPPAGNTILDDEDGFMAKDIFAAFESVQKDIDSLKFNFEEKPSKQIGLKGKMW